VLREGYTGQVCNTHSYTNGFDLLDALTSHHVVPASTGTSRAWKLRWVRSGGGEEQSLPHVRGTYKAGDMKYRREGRQLMTLDSKEIKSPLCRALFGNTQPVCGPGKVDIFMFICIHIYLYIYMKCAISHSPSTLFSLSIT